MRLVVYFFFQMWKGYLIVGKQISWFLFAFSFCVFHFGWRSLVPFCVCVSIFSFLRSIPLQPPLRYTPHILHFVNLIYAQTFSICAFFSVFFVTFSLSFHFSVFLSFLLTTLYCNFLVDSVSFEMQLYPKKIFQMFP